MTKNSGINQKQIMKSAETHHGNSSKKDSAKAESFLESGGDLLSRSVTSQVPSALKGLTSVFGMGTGVTPSS